MSTATAIYRIRVADAGASVVEGNVALTLTQADITETPILSGPSVEPLAGKTVSMPFSVRCITDSVLFTDSGRLTGLGRLAEIQRSVDGGAFVTIGTGRISHFAESARGGIDVSVSDERWVERNSEIFRTTDTIQLHPPGLAVAWNGKPAAGEATYVVLAVESNDLVKIGPQGETRTENMANVPEGLKRALATDLVAPEDRDGSATNSAGNFTSLRFRSSSVDYTVLSFRPLLGGASGGLTHTGLLGTLALNVPGGVGRLAQAWVYIESHGLSVGNTIDGRFYFSDFVQVNDHAPLHIGGATGIHPMVLLQDILDGDYGGEPVNYDSAAMAALQALSMRPVWARITEPKDRAKWLEASLYAPHGVVPLVGTDLQLRPTSFWQPQDEDPDTYTELGASGASGLTWEHTSRDLVTVIAWKSQALIPLDDDAGGQAADFMDAEEQALTEIEHDNVATLGRIVREIKTDLMWDNHVFGWDRYVFGVAHALATELFHVFGDGAQRGRITVPDTAAVQVGDTVVLDQDTLKGYNPGTGARTGDRIVMLLGFSEMRPDATTFEFLDLGPDAQALDVPTVSVAQSVTDLELIEVTISDVPVGATAIVEVEIAASPPTTFTYVRAGVGNETVNFRVPNPTGNAYARAKSVQPGRISSDWGTDDVALTAAPRISATVRRTGTGVVVTWTALSNTAGVRTSYEIHSLAEQPTNFANQADFDVADGGFSFTIPGTRDMATVQLVPYPTFGGGSVSGTPGTAVVLQALRPRAGGGGGRAPTVREDYTRRRATAVLAFIDADAETVVAAVGDSQTVKMYVTVGDGTTPSDPTASVNDGEINGASGSVSTGVAITPGQDAIVKVIAEDNLGELSEVVTTRATSVVGSARFTAADPVFSGSVTVEAGEGGDRIVLTNDTGRGSLRLFNASAVLKAAITAQSAGVVIATFGSDDMSLTPGTSGLIIITQIPSSDPGVAGALWHSSGDLRISL
jgi:hypothetical protein